MSVGGYKIVDLKNTNVTSADGATISGVYEALENNYRKTVMLSGIVIDGVEYADVYVAPTVADSNYTFTAYGKTFTVTNADKITIA